MPPGVSSEQPRQAREPAVARPPPPAPGENFTVTDGISGLTTTEKGDPYTGPVQGITSQFIKITSHNLNVTSNIPNVFIHSGDGQDGLNVSKANGNNILDGSTNSNFLTGGT